MTGAEIAGVVLGGFGSVTGVAALVQNHFRAKQSDRIQERLAEVEEARRRDELRPALDMTSRVDAENTVVTIRNGDRADLDHLEIIEVIAAPPVIERGIRSALGATYSLRIGEALPIAVVVRDEEKAGGTLVLKLRVRCGADQWDLAPACTVDHSIGPQVF
jgi:hypothetical protein